jgi:hypothetical protein
VRDNLNGGFVQSFANHSGLVATVTGEGLVVPTTGNQYWFEYGGRIGYRITKSGPRTFSRTARWDRSRSATRFTAASACA